jgi:hypothetical protein
MRPPCRRTQKYCLPKKVTGPRILAMLMPPVCPDAVDSKDGARV